MSDTQHYDQQSMQNRYEESFDCDYINTPPPLEDLQPLSIPSPNKLPNEIILDDTFDSKTNSDQILLNSEGNNENTFSHFESSKKWLNYQEYFHILEEAEKGNYLYPFYDLGTDDRGITVHPEDIYSNPSSTLYILKCEHLKNGKPSFGFPRLSNKRIKYYTWKKQGFTTDLPKNNPIVRYITANCYQTVRCGNKGGGAYSHVDPLFRMHAVMKIENNNNNKNHSKCVKNNRTYSMNEIGPYVLIHITAASASSTTSTAVSTPNNYSVGNNNNSCYDISYSDVILHENENRNKNDNKIEIENDNDNKQQQQQQFKIEKRKYKNDISCNNNSGSLSSSQLLNIPLPITNFTVTKSRKRPHLTRGYSLPFPTYNNNNNNYSNNNSDNNNNVNYNLFDISESVPYMLSSKDDFLCSPLIMDMSPLLLSPLSPSSDFSFCDIDKDNSNNHSNNNNNSNNNNDHLLSPLSPDSLNTFSI